MNTSELATIVHDLKNPLSIFALDIAVLEHMIDETPPIPSVLQRMRRNVQFMTELVHALLDLDRIESGRLRRTATRLLPLIESVLDHAVSAGDRPRVELAARSSPTVMADGHLVERALTNIVDNAIRHSPRESPIAVAVRRMRGRAIVSVTNRARLDALAGSGLGLCITKRIAEAHGGRIAIDRPRGAFRVVFDLPLG